MTPIGTAAGRSPSVAGQRVPATGGDGFIGSHLC